VIKSDIGLKPLRSSTIKGEVNSIYSESFVSDVDTSFDFTEVNKEETNETNSEKSNFSGKSGQKSFSGDDDMSFDLSVVNGEETSKTNLESQSTEKCNNNNRLI
jgi:hypothetical protein